MGWIIAFICVCQWWFIRSLKKELRMYQPQTEESEYARTIRRVHEKYGVPFDPERYGIKPNKRKGV